MDIEWTDTLRTFAEAMVDLDRLKIVGELARGQGRVLELAEHIQMDIGTVRDHLDQLSKSGVVTVIRGETGEEWYSLDSKNLEQMARQNFVRARELQNQEPDQRKIGTHFTPTEAKVIRNFTTKSGKITALPASRKKRLVILRYALQVIEPGQVYTEKEVNQLFARYSKDTASLRRYLIDHGYLERNPDGSEYRRKEVSDD